MLVRFSQRTAIQYPHCCVPLRSIEPLATDGAWGELVLEEPQVLPKLQGAVSWAEFLSDLFAVSWWRLTLIRKMLLHASTQSLPTCSV